MPQSLYKNAILEVRRLERARALLAKPNGWTRGWYAKTQKNNEANPRSRAAVSFCVLGACDRVGASTQILSEIVIPKRANTLPDWNDHPDRTQEQVLALFDKAIKIARKRAEALR